MKTPQYLEAIDWIAFNDEPTIVDALDMRDMISVLLIADLFGVRPDLVAGDVVRVRKAHLKPIGVRT